MVCGLIDVGPCSKHCWRGRRSVFSTVGTSSLQRALPRTVVYCSTPHHAAKAATSRLPPLLLLLLLVLVLLLGRASRQ